MRRGKNLGFVVLAVVGLSCGDRPPQATADRDTVTAPPSAVRSDTAPARGNCAANPPATDRTICIDRIGPITRSATRDQLNSLFENSILVDTAVHVGEAQFEPGTIIHRGRADSISVIWADSTRSRIASFTGIGSAWRTLEGLGVGSALVEMEKALGPFAVLGFGWDYGGTAMLANTPLQDSGIFFRMTPRSDTTMQTAAYQRVRGDKPYVTTTDDVRSLDLIVGSIDVRWR